MHFFANFLSNLASNTLTPPLLLKYLKYTDTLNSSDAKGFLKSRRDQDQKLVLLIKSYENAFLLVHFSINK